MVNYYPWNVKALVEWLNCEFGHNERQKVQEFLAIPIHAVQGWYGSPSPVITLKQIRAIANYRGWNLNQTIDWLGINGSHLQELIDKEWVD